MDRKELNERCAYWYYQGRRFQALVDAEYGEESFHVRGSPLREVWAEALADTRANWPDVDPAELLRSGENSTHCSVHWLLDRSTELLAECSRQWDLKVKTLGARKE